MLFQIWLSQNYVFLKVSDIALSRNTLAIHIFTTRWLLRSSCFHKIPIFAIQIGLAASWRGWRGCGRLREHHPALEPQHLQRQRAQHLLPLRCGQVGHEWQRLRQRLHPSQREVCCHCSLWKSTEIFPRFLLRYLSGLFSYQSEPKFATRLQVFERKTLEDESLQPWVVEVNQIKVEDYCLHFIQINSWWKVFTEEMCWRWQTLVTATTILSS